MKRFGILAILIFVAATPVWKAQRGRVPSDYSHLINAAFPGGFNTTTIDSTNDTLTWGFIPSDSGAIYGGAISVNDSSASSRGCNVLVVLDTLVTTGYWAAATPLASDTINLHWGGIGNGDSSVFHFTFAAPYAMTRPGMRMALRVTRLTAVGGTFLLRHSIASATMFVNLLPYYYFTGSGVVGAQDDQTPCFAVKMSTADYAGPIYCGAAFADTLGLIEATWDTASSPNELGMVMRLAGAHKINGGYIYMRQVGAGTHQNWRMCLYDSAGAEKGCSQEAFSTSLDGNWDIYFEEQPWAVAPGALFRLGIKAIGPVATGTLSIFTIDVGDSVNLLNCIDHGGPKGSPWYLTTRSNGGAWTDRPSAYIIGLGVLTSATSAGQEDGGIKGRRPRLIQGQYGAADSTGLIQFEIVRAEDEAADK